MLGYEMAPRHSESQPEASAKRRQERPNAHHLIAVMPSCIAQLNKQMRSKAQKMQRRRILHHS